MKDQTITIRDAVPQDAETIAHLIRVSFREVATRFSLTPENCPKHPSNCTVAWVESDQTRGVKYFILSQDDQALGCVALESPNHDLRYLERLAVAPEKQRQGFGRALVLHALACAQARGVREVSIGIIDKDTELKRWYTRLGFIETQTKRFPHLPFRVSFMRFDIEKSANVSHGSDA